MPNILGSGTNTPPDTLELTLFEDTVSRYYGAEIDLDEMLAGDTTTIRVYTKVLAADAYKKFFEQVFTDADGGQATPVFMIPFKSGPTGYKLTIQQTVGTLRSYKWRVDST